jgi:signal transduction histidine kinase
LAAEKPRVLVVEDERIVARDIQQILVDLGYDAYAIAASADEALARATERVPDLVLMDIRIRGPVDGVAAADMLRQRFDVPVIFVTANADEETIARAGKAEPFGYLVKPIQPADLRSAIEIALRRHELERRIREASRLKSELLATVSHEIRTPLNSIIGFAELLADGKVDPVLQREFIGDILTSARHLVQMITDLLDLAKAESGAMELHPEPLDITRIAGQVRDIVRGIAMKKRIMVDIVATPEFQPATLDPVRLKQVFYNLLSNAIKFTPEAGSVTVKISNDTAPGTVRIDVVDTGIGVAPEHIDDLFVAYRTLDTRDKRPERGTGLGLAITRRIAIAMGGRVEVTSALGSGSTFSVIVPR